MTFPKQTDTMTAIIIFTKNEEQTIAQVIDNLYQCLKQIPDLNFTVFVCDDSEDKTAEIAEKKGCQVIRGSGRGLGWSYYLALWQITSKYTFHSIITLDGDGQTDFSEISDFYKEFKKGYSLVIGSRFLKRESISYKYPRINFLGVKVLSLIISLATLKRFTDSHGGLRIISSSLAKNFRFLGGHSYVQETIIDAVEKGLKVKEIPSKWNKRNYGQSRVVRSQIQYAKKMLIPLLIRMKFHWILALIVLLFFKLFYIILSICILIELYKITLFRKNKKWIISKYTDPV